MFFVYLFLGKFTCDHGNWLCLVLDQYGQMGVLGGETGMVFNVKTTRQQQLAKKDHPFRLLEKGVEKHCTTRFAPRGPLYATNIPPLPPASVGIVAVKHAYHCVN